MRRRVKKWTVQWSRRTLEITRIIETPMTQSSPFPPPNYPQYLCPLWVLPLFQSTFPSLTCRSIQTNKPARKDMTSFSMRNSTHWTSIQTRGWNLVIMSRLSSRRDTVRKSIRRFTLTRKSRKNRNTSWRWWPSSRRPSECCKSSSDSSATPNWSNFLPTCSSSTCLSRC